MLDFESYKNEIVNSIEELKEELKQEHETTNEILIDIFKLNSDDEDQEVIEDIPEEKENESDEYLSVSSENEVSEILTIIEQNDLLLEQLEEMNKNSIESAWLISLTIVIALGFHYFINQFSKW